MLVPPSSSVSALPLTDLSAVVRVQEHTPPKVGFVRIDDAANLWNQHFSRRDQHAATALSVGNTQPNSLTKDTLQKDQSVALWRSTLTFCSALISHLGGLVVLFAANTEEQRQRHSYLKPWAQLFSRWQTTREHFLDVAPSPVPRIPISIFTANTVTLLCLELFRGVLQSMQTDVATGVSAHLPMVALLAAFTLNNGLMVHSSVQRTGNQRPLRGPDYLCLVGAGLGVAALAASGIVGATVGASAAAPYVVTGIVCTALVRSLGIWSLCRHVNDQLESARKQRRHESPETRTDSPSGHFNIPPPNGYHWLSVASVLTVLATPWSAAKIALPLIILGQNLFTSVVLDSAQREQRRLGV